MVFQCLGRILYIGISKLNMSIVMNRPIGVGTIYFYLGGFKHFLNVYPEHWG